MVAAVVSGAALKGDHLDIEERRKERGKRGGYIYIYTELASTFTLREPIPRSLPSFPSRSRDTENTRAVPVDPFLSRTSNSTISREM